MTTKTPTIQGVRAKLKREAAAAGLHLELKHSLKGWRRGVQVDTGYASDARRANLKHFTEYHVGTIMDWLRSVLSYEELVTVPVLVIVNNSEMQIDYFSEDHMRVLPDWATFVQLGSISLGWANNLLGEEHNGWTYDRGTRAFTEAEVDALAPSDAHALALAYLVTYERAASSCSTTVDRIANCNETGRALFQSMLSDWTGTVSELLDAVEALVPQELPALVEPAQAEPVRVEPVALVDYLGRLLHAPKKEYAVSVWAAVRDGAAVPEHSADWAADVVRKVRRYATA